MKVTCVTSFGQPMRFKHLAIVAVVAIVVVVAHERYKTAGPGSRLGV